MPHSSPTSLLVLLCISAAGGSLAACQHGEPTTPGNDIPHNEMRQREPQWISGQVLGVDQIPIEQYNNSTVRVTVATEGKKNVHLELGPGWYLTEQGLAFEPHQRIEFRGHQDPDGEYIAHELRRGDQTIELRDPAGHPRWSNPKPATQVPLAPSESPAPTPPGPSPETLSPSD